MNADGTGQNRDVALATLNYGPHLQRSHIRLKILTFVILEPIDKGIRQAVANEYSGPHGENRPSNRAIGWECVGIDGLAHCSGRMVGYPENGCRSATL